MKRLSIILFSVLVLLAWAWACDKRNATDDSAQKGKEEVEALKSIVLDENGEIAFMRTLVNGPYEIGVETVEDAVELAKVYVGEGFTGEEEYTRTLSGDNGTIKVSSGKASIFYSVKFDVKDIPAFTLNIKNARSMGDIAAGHSGTYHKCNVCGFTWRSTSSTCPMKSKHGK